MDCWNWININKRARKKKAGALVEDKYAIAIISNDQTVGHVPKFLSKLCFLFLKHGATLTAKVTRGKKIFFWFTTRRYGNTSGDYLQIGKEGTYSRNEREEIGWDKEIWQEKKKGMENSLEKRKIKVKSNKNFLCNFFPPIKHVLNETFL